MVDLAEEICSTEWGEWPRPVGVSIQNGEWLFRFRNTSMTAILPPSSLETIAGFN